jgi:hypothetical protein
MGRLYLLRNHLSLAKFHRLPDASIVIHILVQNGRPIVKGDDVMVHMPGVFSDSIQEFPLEPVQVRKKLITALEMDGQTSSGDIGMEPDGVAAGEINDIVAIKLG